MRKLFSGVLTASLPSMGGDLSCTVHMRDNVRDNVDFIDVIYVMFAFLCLHSKKKMFQLLSLFPSEEAIKRGDKDYHAAVNIANEMHNRYAHWSQGGW